MRIIETKDISIDKIVKFPFQSRLDKEKLEELGADKEKIKKYEEDKSEKVEGMANSFDKSGLIGGLLNSVIVREKEGKYQLIAGNLRLKAFQLAEKKEISAKIIEANDLEARLISFIENYHRQDLIDIEKERDIYDLWIYGNEKLFNNNKSIMSKKLGIPYDTLLAIIQAGEEKHKEKEKKKEEQSNVIINATANDLKETRQLEKIDSETRKELLRAKVEDKISRSELRPVVKAIKRASEKNAPKEVLKGIANLVSEKKLNPQEAEEFANAVTQIPKEEQKQLVETIKKEEKVNIDEVKNFVSTYITVPPDIQKKMIEKKVDIKEAKIVSKFPTTQEREQVLEERKVIAKMGEEEIEKHTEIRLKQREEVQKYGDRKPGNLTNIDLDKMKKDFYDSDEQADQHIIDNYQKAMEKTQIFKTSTVNNIRSERNKRIVIDFIWQAYENCYMPLVELGEIKIIGRVNPRKSPVPPRLYR